MSKTKKLFKNIGFLTISNFSSKILIFLLLPLYTNILTTEEYGIYDALSTTIALLIPIFTFNISEALFRFSLDKINDCKKKKIFSISFKFFLIGLFILLIIVIINKFFFNVFNKVSSYTVYFVLMYFLGGLTNILTYFSRGINKIKHLSISGIISTIIIIILNILFLVTFKMGLKGYLISTLIGQLSQCIYLIISLKVWEYITFKIRDKKCEKEMLKYCLPLIFNNISWWISSASDRYMVIFFCGLSENGVYSVSYKIPTILTTVSTIFGQAWSITAVEDFDEKDSDGFFSILYNLYCCFMICLCSFFIMFNKLLAYLLYGKDFYSAWKYVPFLMLSFVFSALSTYAGGILTAKKNSKILAISSTIGAVSNIVVNLMLIPFIGCRGAAISTALSYGVMWIIRMKYVEIYVTMKLSKKRDFCAFGLLILQCIFMSFWNGKILYFIQITCIILIIILFKKEIYSVKNKLLLKIKKQQ